jgi:hypothetical protein
MIPEAHSSDFRWNQQESHRFSREMTGFESRNTALVSGTGPYASNWVVMLDLQEVKGKIYEMLVFHNNNNVMAVKKHKFSI